MESPFIPKYCSYSETCIGAAENATNIMVEADSGGNAPHTIESQSTSHFCLSARPIWTPQHANKPTAQVT